MKQDDFFSICSLKIILLNKSDFITIKMTALEKSENAAHERIRALEIQNAAILKSKKFGKEEKKYLLI